jgi:poly(A) polymerase
MRLQTKSTGAWTATTLAEDRPAPNLLPQIRSLAAHRDRATGADYVFAGNDPRGIFAGSYDPARPGRIRWGAAPELDISAISTAGFRGLAGRLRVNAFAECDGVLYAAVGQQIYRRDDGAAPRWRLVYTNPDPGHSETGLRGLTAVPNPAGQGEVLLAAVEAMRDASSASIPPAGRRRASSISGPSSLPPGGRRWATSSRPITT